MWEKWVFLATLAGATTLMRAAVGDIVAAPGGAAFVAALHTECTAVAAASGFAPRGVVAERARAQLTAAGSTFTASMLRDIENGGRIEADHVIGDLIDRGRRLARGGGLPDARAGLCRAQGLRGPAGAGSGLRGRRSRLEGAPGSHGWRRPPSRPPLRSDASG